MPTLKKKALKVQKPALETPKPGQLVRIVNRGGKEGYRRAGVAHPKSAVDHAHDAFTPAQLEALAADPKLDVRVVDAPAAEGKDAKAS